MVLPSKEAGPHQLAVRFLHWLRQRGYELPGEDKDWYLGKPDLWGRSRRNRYDIEEGKLAWYLAYEGEDEAAIHWSDTFGGDDAPATLINRLDQCELIEHKGWNEHNRYSFFAAMKLQMKEEALAVLPPKMKTIYVFKCSKCGYRMEDHRKDFGERYIHSQCGHDSQLVFMHTVKVEVPRSA